MKKLNISNEDSNISNFVTVSIGASTFIPDDSNSTEKLIKNADMNLYKAKDTGSNKIVF